MANADLSLENILAAIDIINKAPPEEYRIRTLFVNQAEFDAALKAGLIDETGFGYVPWPTEHSKCPCRMVVVAPIK